MPGQAVPSALHITVTFLHHQDIPGATGLDKRRFPGKAENTMYVLISGKVVRCPQATAVPDFGRTVQIW